MRVSSQPVIQPWVAWAFNRNSDGIGLIAKLPVHTVEDSHKYAKWYQLLVSRPGQCLPQWSQEVSGSNELPGAKVYLKDRLLSHKLSTDPFQLSSLFPLHWFVQTHVARSAQGTRGFCTAVQRKAGAVDWVSAPTGWHGQVERRGCNSKRQDIRAGVLIPTETYGVILCSFNRPSSLMKVRQTRRTAMIKNTRLDKEIKPLRASEVLSPTLCCARRSRAGESDHLKEQSWLKVQILCHPGWYC